MKDYRTENITYWTKRASGYSEVNREELRMSQREVWSRALDTRIQRHFGERKRETIQILDVGTGPGFFAIILTEMGYRVTAVDYTEAMLEQGRRNAGDLAERIDFRQMNAEELSFPDSSFDVVVSRNLTWNLSRPEQAYSHWARVLKPGGLLLNFDANWYRYLYDDEAKDRHLRDREYVRKSGALNRFISGKFLRISFFRTSQAGSFAQFNGGDPACGFEQYFWKEIRMQTAREVSHDCHENAAADFSNGLQSGLQPRVTTTFTSVPAGAGGITFPFKGVPSTVTDRTPFCTWAELSTVM